MTRHARTIGDVVYRRHWSDPEPPHFRVSVWWLVGAALAVAGGVAVWLGMK